MACFFCQDLTCVRRALLWLWLHVVLQHSVSNSHESSKTGVRWCWSKCRLHLFHPDTRMSSVKKLYRQKARHHLGALRPSHFPNYAFVRPPGKQQLTAQCHLPLAGAFVRKTGGPTLPRMSWNQCGVFLLIKRGKITSLRCVLNGRFSWLCNLCFTEAEKQHCKEFRTLFQTHKCRSTVAVRKLLLNGCHGLFQTGSTQELVHLLFGAWNKQDLCTSLNILWPNQLSWSDPHLC